MPSLEQLRYEALAAEVERLSNPRVLKLIGPINDPLITRVEMTDGRTVDFRLTGVELDGAMLVGRRKRKLTTIPLSDVKAIWRRRYHPRRTAIACGATIVITTATLAVGSSAPLAAVLLSGPVFGLPVAGGICVLLNQFGVLTEWVPLYDRAQ